MRCPLLLSIAIVALAARVALGQTSPPAAGAKPQETPTPGTTPWTGRFDFGVRGTTVDGDAARYERYRDLGDGLFLESARVHREYEGWLVDFTGEHVGRKDQRYVGSVVRPGRLTGSFIWDQIPMLLSRTTETLFSGIGTGELTIEDAIQAAAQIQLNVMVTLFDQTAREFELRTRRHIADGRFEYLPSEALTFRASFRHTNRDGTIPFGGSFGHSALVELPAPTPFNLSEFEGRAEYVQNPWLLRAGYTGSWVHNDVTSLVFDNPYRVVDIATASSRGRLTLAPTNSQFAVNGLASVKLPYRSRATAYASIGMLEDNGDPLVPQTINTASSPGRSTGRRCKGKRVRRPST